jgi:hypothetical protein
MNPLMRLALTHPKQPPLHDLQGIGLQVDQHEQQPILWRRQGTVLTGRVPTSGTRPSIEAPCIHMRLERGLKRQHQLPKLLHGETGQIEHLSQAGLQIGEP